MSQVKNLRAMFENKGDTSPPDRGRSPGVSTPTPTECSTTDSPRPLSKVRTSFVAIEKDGRMGLRRNPSDESSISRRRLSNDTDAESTSTFPDKPIMASLDSGATPVRRPFVEPIPESPRQPTEADDLFTAGAVSDKPSTNPDKHVDEEQPSAALLPAEPAAKPTPSKSTKAAPPPTAAVNGKSKTDKAKESAKEGARTVAAAAKAPVSAVKKSVAKPSTISTKSTTQAPAKSPAINAPKKTEAKPAAKPSVKPTVKPSERLVPKKETSATSRTATTRPAASATAAKPAASGASKKPQPLKLGEKSDTGFIKPKPKSPTKPVTLPPSLMAHTASSVSKGAVAGNLPMRQSLSRQSGSLNATGRSPSRLSTATTSASAKTVRRQPSNINRSRPSVGPPPKKPTQQESAAAKRDSNVDEGFLARMMRPTQASSSKTAEKGPLTPPRGTAHRSSTSERSVSSRRESSTRRVANTQSPVPMPVEKAAPQVSAPVPVIEVAPETAVVETAEEVTALAEEADLVQTPVEPAAQLPVDIVHETANVETAEEATALAEEADLVQTPVEPKEPEVEEESEPLPVEEVATETANVETAEEAIELAQEADLVQTPMVPDEPVKELAETESAVPSAAEGEELKDTAESITEPVEATPEPAPDSEVANEPSEALGNAEEPTEDAETSLELDAPIDAAPSDTAPIEPDAAAKLGTELVNLEIGEKKDAAVEEKQHTAKEPPEEEEEL